MALDNEGMEMITDLTPPLDEAVLLKDIYQKLFSQMSHNEKQLFVLLVDERSPSEISRLFAISESGVRKRISRLKAKIRNIYKDLHNLPPP